MGPGVAADPTPCRSSSVGRPLYITGEIMIVTVELVIITDKLMILITGTSVTDPKLAVVMDVLK